VNVLNSKENAFNVVGLWGVQDFLCWWV